MNSTTCAYPVFNSPLPLPNLKNWGISLWDTTFLGKPTTLGSILLKVVTRHPNPVEISPKEISKEADWSPQPAKTRKPKEIVAAAADTDTDQGLNDPFTKYLQEIGREEEISAEEENRLSALVKAGGPAGDAAKERLWTANLKLVVAVAKKYTKYGVHISDLTAEGNLGLGKAIDKFDPTKGARLATYAVWWIKQHIRKAITENGRTIRIPICQQKTVRKIHEAASRLTELTGSYPSDEEIADEIGESTLKVQNLRNLTVPMVSLQTPVECNGSKEPRTYEDILSDNTGSGESPFEKLGKKNIERSIAHLIQKRLNKREQEVLQLRFGLGEHLEENRTLKVVGEMMNLTRERVRQIQDSALKKLKRTLEAHEADEPTVLSLLPRDL